MKTSTTLLTIICWLLLLSGNQLSAQSTDSLYHVETNDGNEYIGTIVEQNEQSVKIKTEKLGVLTILRIDIKNITPVKKEAIKAGKYWFHNPQSTRYFWGPTGYGLKKGEGYYQNVWIYGNQVSVGVTDHISIGVGMIPAFLFFGAPTPVWVTPKVSIPLKKDKVNVGLGVMAGTVLGVEDEYDYEGDKTNSNFGIAYGVTTFGSRDKNLSIGLGYGYAGGGWAKSPTVTMSFMIRTGDRGYIISENYLFSSDRESTGVISIGGRRLVKKVAIDFGGMMPVVSEGYVIVLPWLGISVPFQVKKKS